MAGSKPGRKSKAETLGLPYLLDKVVGPHEKILVVERLANIAMNSVDEKSALKAIELLLAYLYGKPAQTVDVSARVIAEYEVIWPEDNGAAPEAPSLTSGSQESLGAIQGVVLRSTLGKDSLGLLDVDSNGA